MGLVLSFISVDLYRRDRLWNSLHGSERLNVKVWEFGLLLCLWVAFSSEQDTLLLHAMPAIHFQFTFRAVFYVAVSFADQCFLSSFPWSLWCFLCSAAVASFLWCTFPCSLTCSFSFPSISPLDTRHTYFPPACFSQASEPFHFSVVSAAASRSNCC